MADANAKHAKSQRKYAAKLRKTGAPRSDDLGRAMVAAARASFERQPIPGDRKTWWFLMRSTVNELVARGFDEQEAKKRLWRAVGLDPR